MGKNKKRSDGKVGNLKAVSAPLSRLSIVSEKNEVEKKSNLGLVCCCMNRKITTQVDWYKVDSVLEKGRATRFPSPSVFEAEGFSCASMGSKVIVLGGSILDKGLQECRSAYCLDKDDPGNKVLWTRLPDMISARHSPHVVTFQNKVYVFGSYIYDPISPIPTTYGEFLDMSLPHQQWKWKPLPEPPFRKIPNTQLYWPLSAAFVLNIDRQEEIALGLCACAETFTLNLETHEWTDRTGRYPNLRWWDINASVVVVDDILLMLGGGALMPAYDFKSCLWFPHHVSGLEKYPILGEHLFQSTRKRDVYLVVCDVVPEFVPPPTVCVRFQIKRGRDPNSVPTASAVVKSTTGPFHIVTAPFFVLPLGHEGEEEKELATNPESSGHEGEEEKELATNPESSGHEGEEEKELAMNPESFGHEGEEEKELATNPESSGHEGEEEKELATNP